MMPILPSKEIFLEDKGKALSYPGEMHDDDIKFHIDVNEYGKSPLQSLREIFNDVGFWERQEQKVKALGGAVKDFVATIPEGMGQDLTNLLGVTDISDPAQAENRKKIIRSGTVILNSIFETVVGRIREPIRQYVGDAMLGDEQTDRFGNVVRAVIDPSTVEKISFRAPLTEAERESTGVIPLVPRAILSAVEDVFVYGANLKALPQMVENYEINAARNLVQRDIKKFVDIVKAKTPLNDEQAMAYLSRPDVLKYISSKAKFGKVNLYSGVPALPEDLGAAGKALGQGASEAISSAAKSPAVAGKVAQEILKTRGFVESIQETLPKIKSSGQYTPRATDELAQKARTLISENPDVAEKMAMTGTDDASIATGAELLKHYSALAESATEPAVANALYDKAAELGNSMAERLTELGRSVQAASILARLTPEGQLQFAAKTIQKYNAMVEKDSGLFGLKKKIPELTPEQGKKIVEDMKEIAALPDGEAKAIRWKEMQDYVSDLVPTPLLKKITTVWKAGLLTGVKTSGLNIFSNASHAFGTEVLKDLPAAAVDSVVSLFTKKRAVAFTTKGMGAGASEGFKKGWQFLKTGYDERRMLEKFDYKRVNFGKGRVAKGLQAYEETIFKLLGAQDQVFYYAAKARSIAEQAIVAAKNNGLKGQAAKKFIDDLVQNPTDDMVALAVADAETAVFQNETFLSRAGSAIQRVPGAEFVLPFSRTPSAVAMQIINYSPVGAVKTALRNIGAGKFNQRDFSKGMGRALLGVPVLWLGYELYRQGRLALDKPKTEGERKLWEAEGRKPNSVKIGDKWRSVQVLGPAGNLVLIGGQLSRAMSESGSVTAAVSDTMAGGAKSFTEQTFLKGMSMGIEAMTDPARSGEYFVSGLVSSAIPTLVSDLARATDRTERRTNGIAEAVAARIPVIRNNLQAQIDIVGRERVIPENFFEIMFDPSRPMTATSDPVIKEIRRIIDAGYDISTTQLGGREGYKILTEEQNTELWQRAGAIAYDKTAAYMQMDAYDQTDDEIKAKDIDRIFDKAKVIARVEKVLEITEGLEGAALQQKLSEAKKDGLLNREVFDQFKKIR